MKPKHNRKWNRILKLADFVAKVPSKRFNFKCWVGIDWMGAKDLSCGTTACALGWATTMPFFRRLGLYLAMKDRGYHLGQVPWVVLNGDGSDDGRATLFGISVPTFQRLFVPLNGLSEDATPKEWAKHARKIVAQLKAGEIA